MARWSMFVSPPVPDYVKDDLVAAFDVTLNETGGVLATDQLVKALEGKQILLTWIGERINADVIARLPSSVKAIATYSVGYDHVDVEAARARGIAVFNTPEVLTDTVAEVTMLFTLGVARRVTESVALVRGDWKGWTPLQLNGVELVGKTMGIFGFGRIGRAIAERARAFRMKIAYSDIKRLPAELEEGATFYAAPDDLVRNSNVLVLACNSTPETRSFLNRERLGLLPDKAIVVNISRGDIVNDDALIEALQAGRILGAGLDVFNNEPKIDPRYRTLPNAFIMPHIGSSTYEARQRMGRILIEGVQALMDGKSARNRLA